MSDFEQRVRDAIANPHNQGEMNDADSVGTVGSADCGDMLRMWLKFKEDDQGRKIIDRASFQAFGCQTAMAVASLATEMLQGKTVEEASKLSANELSEGLGPLPPMKIHCGQLVEGALSNALGGDSEPADDTTPATSTLAGEMNQATPPKGKIKINLLPPEED